MSSINYMQMIQGSVLFLNVTVHFYFFGQKGVVNIPNQLPVYISTLAFNNTAPTLLSQSFKFDLLFPLRLPFKQN